MTKYIWQLAKWPQFVFDANELLVLLGRVRRLQGELLARAHGMGLEAKVSVITDEAVTTAAIEGERLDRTRVRSSVARRLGLSTAGMPGIDRNADGLIEVLLDATEQFNVPMTQKRLKSWQAALFPTGYSGMYEIRVGKWRYGDDPMQVVSGRAGRERVHFEAPPSERIPNEVSAFLNWLNHPPRQMDGIVRAAIAHLYFVTIHPFDDGNGRIARAITDYVLAADEGTGRRLYSMSLQISKDRDRYYEVLEQTQKGNLNVTVWLKWFFAALESAMATSISQMDKAIDTGTFWASVAEIPLNERQRQVVARLLEAGPSGFEGGLNNRKYVGMTKVSRETAKRDLVDLVKKRILIPTTASGRSVAYELTRGGTDVPRTKRLKRS
ncbi:MAG: Fic family protein [Deltaproteobacteria bacterium]|nr:Fic family protein [Deltaproteobacteria bacterium]